MYATTAGSRNGNGGDNNVAQPVSAIQAFYQSLCPAGKVKMLALIAHMHKLLSVLNAMLKSGMPW